MDTTPKIIIDTSAFIPVLLKSHPTATASILQLAVDQVVKLYTSRPCLDELEETITRKKFVSSTARPKEDIQKMVQQYDYLCHLVTPLVDVDVCRDEKDNKFLSLAKHIKADFLITVDNDLLTLNPFENTVICRGRDFIDMLEKSRTVKYSP
jgi:putative PIN family toxin of toxin-antitoxin system